MSTAHYSKLVPVFLLASGIAGAAVVKDGSLKTSGSIAVTKSNTNTGPRTDYTIDASAGSISGTNLFHSFSKLDLTKDEAAIFTGPSSIRNVIARVTGGPSSIDGRINVSIPRANFYLMNPRGVVFGPNAKLEISGSFVVTTADELRFGDGVFSAYPTKDSGVLSTQPPAAFGFLHQDPAHISVADKLILDSPTSNQQKIQSISIVSGNIELNHSHVEVPEFGRFNLIAVGSPGKVTFDGDDPKAFIGLSGFKKLAEVGIINGSDLHFAGEGGGSVVIRGRGLTLKQSQIEAITRGGASGGTVDATGFDTILISDGAAISASNFGPNSGADILLEARQIDVSGVDPVTGAGATVSANTRSGGGDAGKIDVSARNLNLTDRGSITADTTGPGSGGEILIHLRPQGLLTLDNGSITSQTAPPGNGVGGLVVIDGRTDGQALADARLSGGAVVSASTFGEGPGGNVQFFVRKLGIQGQVQRVEALPASITATTEAGDDIHAGDAGEIDLNVSQLTLLNGANVSGASNSRGMGGSIHVLGDDAYLDGIFSSSSPIDVANAARTGIYVTTKGKFSGAGGTIRVELTGDLTILHGAKLSASTSGSGAGGDITVVMPSARNVLLRGDVADPHAVTGIVSDSQQDALGPGGKIDLRLDSGTLTIESGARISSHTSSDSDGGNISIQTQHLLLNSNRAPQPTGILADTSSIGNGGNVEVHSADLLIQNSARISANSNLGLASASIRGSGDAGSVRVDASGPTMLRAGGAISALSNASNAGDVFIQTSNLTLFGSAISVGAAGKGGNISIQSGSITYAINGKINAQGSESLGSISLNQPLLVLNHSTVLTRTAQQQGGDIDLAGTFRIQSSDSSITASGQLNENIQTIPFTGIVQLPTVSLSSTSLQQECAMRFQEDFSSFVVEGTGGLPLEPDRPQLTLTLRSPATKPTDAVSR